MSKLEQVDYDFIREMYPHGWTFSELAEKLEVDANLVQAAVTYMGLKPLDKGLRVTALDWPSIWYSYAVTGCYKAAAKAAGVGTEAAIYAIDTMIKEGGKRRLIRWNRYARANGRPEYSASDMVTIQH